MSHWGAYQPGAWLSAYTLRQRGRVRAPQALQRTRSYSSSSASRSVVGKYVSYSSLLPLTCSSGLAPLVRNDRCGCPIGKMLPCTSTASPAKVNENENAMGQLDKEEHEELQLHGRTKRSAGNQ